MTGISASIVLIIVSVLFCCIVPIVKRKPTGPGDSNEQSDGLPNNGQVTLTSSDYFSDLEGFERTVCEYTGRS